MITISIGRRGQITLPSRVRRQLGIQEGDRLALELHADQLILRPITHTLLEFRGRVKVSAPQDFDAIRQEVHQEQARRLVKDEP